MDKSDTRLENRLCWNRLQNEYTEFSRLGSAQLWCINDLMTNTRCSWENTISQHSIQPLVETSRVQFWREYCLLYPWVQCYQWCLPFLVFSFGYFPSNLQFWVNFYLKHLELDTLMRGESLVCRICLFLKDRKALMVQRSL